MQFYYGSFTFDDNSVNYASINRTFTRGQTQRLHLLHVNWQMRGKIVRNLQSDIWAEYTAIQNALYVDGSNAGFNGTPFQLGGQNALGGCRVTNPVSHEGLAGAEGITYLRYTFGLEADFLWSKAQDVLNFNEQISFTDNLGLPIYVERIPAIGLPLLQQVTQASWYKATQSGILEQSGPNPTPMAPIFGLNLLQTSGNAASNVVTRSPTTIKGYPIKYGITWSYNFISATPLIGSPNALG